MKKLQPSETQIEIQVLDYFAKRGWFAFSKETIGAGGNKRAKRYTRFALKGIPDSSIVRSFGLLPVHVEIEFKRPGQPRTPGQLAFALAYDRKGGHYWLIDSLEVAKEKERELEVWINKRLQEIADSVAVKSELLSGSARTKLPEGSGLSEPEK